MAKDIIPPSERISSNDDHVLVRYLERMAYLPENRSKRKPWWLSHFKNGYGNHWKKIL